MHRLSSSSSSCLSYLSYPSDLSSSRGGERGIDNPAMIDLNDESNRLSGHQDPRCWLLPELARVEAERRLFNKLDGTFLIRRSAAGNAPYALSIAYRGVEKGVG